MIVTLTVKEVQENDLNLLLMAQFYGFHDDFVDVWGYFNGQFKLIDQVFVATVVDKRIYKMQSLA